MGNNKQKKQGGDETSIKKTQMGGRPRVKKNMTYRVSRSHSPFNFFARPPETQKHKRSPIRTSKVLYVHVHTYASQPKKHPLSLPKTIYKRNVPTFNHTFSSSGGSCSAPTLVFPVCRQFQTPTIHHPAVVIWPRYHPWRKSVPRR